MWTSLLAPVVGVLVVVGIVCVVVSLQPMPVVPHRPQQSLWEIWCRMSRRPAGEAGRRRDLMLLGGIVVGLVAAVITRWVVLIVLVPVLMQVLPKLFGQAPRSDLPLIEALERWVRVLAAVRGHRDVIGMLRESRGSTPPLISEPVNALVDRLNARWETTEALQQFADELDSSEADAVVASLVLATRRGGGLTANLTAIAESLQHRIRALREVEKERAKPRNAVRIVTIITLVMIGLAALVGGQYLAPLASPIGQVLAAALGAGYVGSLLMMHRISAPRKRARILISPHTGARS